MNHFYMIGGAMGVGKTAVSRELLRLLPGCVMLDGDWCWYMDPFRVNEETKRVVMDNITFCLDNLLRCGQFENVVFCWVMHQREIIEDILGRLCLEGWQVHNISLVCDESTLRERLWGDIEAGIRSEDVIGRSVERLPLYDALPTEKIDVSRMTAREAAELIAQASSSPAYTRDVPG